MNIPASRYLPYFKEYGPKLSETMEVSGDILLVERMKFPETKTASGLILATDSAAARTMNGIGADKPGFYRVLHVGAGFVGEDGADVPLDVKPGDVILIGAVSVKLFSMFPLLEAYEPDSIGITRETDIQIRFHGEDNFIEFLKSFNESTKAQMVAGQK
jgi:co-chaperonin GroES (HSP10)